MSSKRQDAGKLGGIATTAQEAAKPNGEIPCMVEGLAGTVQVLLGEIELLGAILSPVCRDEPPAEQKAISPTVSTPLGQSLADILVQVDIAAHRVRQLYGRVEL